MLFSGTGIEFLSARDVPEGTKILNRRFFNEIKNFGTERALFKAWFLMHVHHYRNKNVLARLFHLSLPVFHGRADTLRYLNAGGVIK